MAIQARVGVKRAAIQSHSVVCGHIWPVADINVRNASNPESSNERSLYFDAAVSMASVLAGILPIQGKTARRRYCRLIFEERA